MKVEERFIKYVSFDTTSDENSETYPSTHSQSVLLSLLAEELKSVGMSNAAFDGKYTTAYLPGKKGSPTVCFISHVDTSPDVSGKDIKATITDYKGGDIVLPYATISASELKDCVGTRVITSDGSTLLGADDKAGVAAIMTAMEKLVKTDPSSRCNIKVMFTPDEEIGNGVRDVDVRALGADFGYTIDGGPLGEIEYENFNAAGLEVTVFGRSIHPGSAKNIMKNAIDLLFEFHSLLPVEQRPVNTEGYEGFYMIKGVSGGVEKAEGSYIIRDHDMHKFNQKKEFVRSAIEFLNRKYGEGTFVAEIKDSYYNMSDIINKNFHLIESARLAFERVGVTPKSIPIRGGTDGAMLSYKGLPCPNLSTGGYNFHSRTEFVPIESMEKMSEVVIELVRIYANKNT